MPTLDTIIRLSGIGERSFRNCVTKASNGYGYRKFETIKNGKRRWHYDPDSTLRKVQKAIKTVLCQIPSSTFSHSRKTRSYITHARLHVGNAVVVSLDVENCFPSIKPSHVLAVFRSVGFCHSESRTLTHLTTADGELPQGFLTSPVLQNLLFRDIDFRVGNVAARVGCEYSRNVDNLDFSGGRNTLAIIGPVKGIISSYGFRVNSGKLRKEGVQYQHRAQKVCKVVVNSKTSVPKKKIAEYASSIDKLRVFIASGADTSGLESKIAGRISFAKSLNRGQGNNLARMWHQAKHPTHRGKRLLIVSKSATGNRVAGIVTCSSDST